MDCFGLLLASSEEMRKMNSTSLSQIFASSAEQRTHLFLIVVILLFVGPWAFARPSRFQATQNWAQTQISKDKKWLEIELSQKTLGYVHTVRIPYLPEEEVVQKIFMGLDEESQLALLDKRERFIVSMILQFARFTRTTAELKDSMGGDLSELKKVWKNLYGKSYGVLHKIAPRKFRLDLLETRFEDPASFTKHDLREASVKMKLDQFSATLIDMNRLFFLFSEKITKAEEVQLGAMLGINAMTFLPLKTGRGPSQKIQEVLRDSNVGLSIGLAVGYNFKNHTIQIELLGDMDRKIKQYVPGFAGGINPKIILRTLTAPPGSSSPIQVAEDGNGYGLGLPVVPVNINSFQKSVEVMALIPNPFSMMTPMFTTLGGISRVTIASVQIGLKETNLFGIKIKLPHTKIKTESPIKWVKSNIAGFEVPETIKREMDVIDGALSPQAEGMKEQLHLMLKKVLDLTLPLSRKFGYNPPLNISVRCEELF